MNRLVLACLISVLALRAQADFKVHEWGTFTSLVSSDGEAQSGMYYEDEPLPDFVHNFGDKIAFPEMASLNLLTSVPRILSLLPLQTPPIEPPHCPGSPKVPCEFLLEQRITQKMETPVVYFYSDTEQKVSFDVSFPGGIISQSYPAATFSRPEAIPGVEFKNGFAHYEVNVLRSSDKAPPVPQFQERCRIT